MISKRCIVSVQFALSQLDIPVIKVFLGGAIVDHPNIKAITPQIEAALKQEGFELLRSKDEILVEQIKVAVLEMIFYGNNLNTIIRNSDYLSDKLGQPYVALSKLFSEKTGHKLEKYIILVRMERVKELLAYNELTLSEISYQMGYSSVQYLSTQFKQITGISVTEYKSLEIKPRVPLDELI